MRIITTIALLAFSFSMTAQEHFSGIATSKRVGILNGNINPSEFANLSNKFEIQLITVSANISNNKVGFDDLLKSDDFESVLFQGNENVNFDVSAAIYGPAFAMRFGKWGFAIGSKASIQATITDLDSDLGNALINDQLNSAAGITTIFSDENQRVNATTWGEIGISIARNVFETEKHQVNAGATLRLLFPGSYANIGLNNFNGEITAGLNGLRLVNANSTLNLAYSGNFGSSFNETNDYFQSIYGNLNGFAADFGVDYQLLNEDKTYKLKVGASVRNLGAMTFSGDDNFSENYALSIPTGSPGLNLNEFNSVEGLEDIEAVLNNYPEFFTSTEASDEFKVNLPPMLNLYADFQINKRISVTGFLQQKLNNQKNNTQIATQNMFTITPRVTFGNFETYLPIGTNELSGGTLGLGFRLGGFFIGSNSIISAVANNSKQADAHMGFRYGFL